jgi:hypothetical protein
MVASTRVGQIDSDRHVRGNKDGCVPSERRDLLAMRGRESGRADHGSPAYPCHQAQMLEACFRDGELDEQSLGADGRGGVGSDEHTSRTHPRHITGVATDRRMTGRFERRC